ncbi:ATP-dependent helicase [Sanguibacter antarcticus]|uniref:DNA 3'-5' helicase n=1 Tax=Sanguibacter antarcticus TaxID=372484 RepID=A0A2A9E6P9_9MICO|nr:ATP-dependent DNA helicase [Sanguibacter antarcticus]PFG33860.1 superfamily I DNA/RNA helicase [Sanguibacter antarcticus]
MDLLPPRALHLSPSTGLDTGPASTPGALDPSQQRALEGAREAPVALVLGAAGTGKTTLALELVAAAVSDDGLRPDEILVLSATRRGAGVLRDALAARLGMTVRGAVVRTAPSAAFAILAKSAQSFGDPAPTLITGPEQDLVLSELLLGHSRGEGIPAGWPATIPPETLALRGFRDELRDLLMRSAERGVGPRGLAELGERHGRPEWVAAAAIYEEYLDVMALRELTPDAGARFDPAVVVDEAARTLATWDGEDKPRWRLVVVDDYQESTAATARLCHLMAVDGARLVLLADPDSAVQAFRGASPALVGRAAAGRPPAPGSRPDVGAAVGELGAEVFVLETAWRHGPEIRRATSRVTQEIGSVVSAEHRRARPGTVEGDAVEVVVLPSPAGEEALVARTLRAEHLLRGTPWSQMAVVARSGGTLVRLRRALASASVPVALLGADVPLRDEPAVRPLLAALRAAVTGDLTVEVVVDLLTSPLGGLDAVGLRRLRRALRGEELAAGGGRSSDTLLVELLADPAHAASLRSDVGRAPRRVAAMLAAGRAAVDVDGATSQTVLWAVWSAADVSETWRTIAVNGGPGSARADSDLDAVMALFRAAEQFVDRMPQSPPLAFAEYLESQDLPADSLAARAVAGETVQLLTPAGAAGGEWDVIVVAGVQDGTWPDLRLRDSLLGSQALVELLAGRADTASSVGPEARRSVLADELRAFAVAVSRARRRLVVTATRDADNEPSVLVDLLAPPSDDEPDADAAGEAPSPLLAAPLDLRGVVATLRTELAADLATSARTGHPGEAPAIGALLASLAREGLPEADPRTWYGSSEVSSTTPLREPEALVPVSPSKVEQVHRCALRWALESAGGTSADALSQSVGTLIHDIARELPAAGHALLAAELDRRWDELRMPAGWPTVQARRRADGMVRRLAEYYKEVTGEVVVEETFEVQVGRAVLRGAVDRLELTDGGVRVTDLKTGKGIPSVRDAETNAQLGAYQLAVEEGAFASLPAGTRSTGAQLVFISEGVRATKRAQGALGDPETSWARALVEDAAETMAGAGFSAVENAMCSMCGVRRSCPLQSEGRHVISLEPDAVDAPDEADEADETDETDEPSRPGPPSLPGVGDRREETTS